MGGIVPKIFYDHVLQNFTNLGNNLLENFSSILDISRESYFEKVGFPDPPFPLEYATELMKTKFATMEGYICLNVI